MNPNEVRFAADAMCQSLAKWLRLIGYDCAAGDGLFGRALLEMAVTERRWILTRNRRLRGDMPLILLAHANIHLVDSERLPDQLREVVTRFEINPAAFRFTRCIVCNENLTQLPSPPATGAVPAGVLERQHRFWQCKRCSRIYWQGSHAHESIRRLDDWLETPPFDDR